MGKNIKLKLKQLAQTTNELFGVFIFDENIKVVTLNFPETPKLPKSHKEAFKRDIKNVAGDFNKALLSVSKNNV